MVEAPVRVEATLMAALVLVFVAGYVVHWLRRAFRQPHPTEPFDPTHILTARITMFDAIQRLFHWANFAVLGLMIITGVALFTPGAVDSLLRPFGVSGFSATVFWHVTLAWALLGLIAIHIIWDTGVAKGWWNIWPSRHDLRDTATRVRNFFGRTRDYPRMPKYDIFMKTFHWGLTLSLIITGLTGLYFWNPFFLFPQVPYGIEFLFRVLHDVFAFLLVALIIGHIYFALLPTNWPILKAMIVGYLTGDDYGKHFSPTKWRIQPSVAAMPTAEQPPPMMPTQVAKPPASE